MFLTAGRLEHLYIYPSTPNSPNLPVYPPLILDILHAFLTAANKTGFFSEFQRELSSRSLTFSAGQELARQITNALAHGLEEVQRRLPALE